jgi:AraC-like DNA-binding protein
MIEPDHELLSLRVSTDGGKESMEQFRETLARTILRCEIEPPRGRMMDVNFKLSALPGFGLAAGMSSPGCYPHTGNLIDSDDIVLLRLHEGHAEFERANRRTELQPGDVLISSVGEVATLTFLANVRVTTFRFSREILMPYLADLGQTLCSPKLKRSLALDLLLNYANIFEDGVALSSPALRRSVVAHLHEIAALAMGASGDGAQLALEHGVRAARLRAIKADIRGNLADHSLSAGTLAQRHGISQRYVYKLFEQEGATFSEFMVAKRLERARQMLAEPQYAERTISSIAYEAGFGDLSYFNRTFKRRFEMTPSEWRRRRRSTP